MSLCIIARAGQYFKHAIVEPDDVMYFEGENQNDKFVIIVSVSERVELTETGMMQVIFRGINIYRLMTSMFREFS